MRKKLTIVAVIAFFVFDLQQWLPLEGLNAGQARFEAWLNEHPILVSAAYFGLYVIVTALPLPGATIMALAGGALFGFLVARYLLKDAVQSRFGDRLSAINRGVEEEGGFYLFTLRLVPAFPFFLINLLMGLRPIKARTFYWVSQVGMLAGTLVYVNAGTQLGQLDSLSGILSPSLLISFTLLGLFPLVAKKVMTIIRARRALA